MCTIKLGHKDKSTKCRFFAVAAEDPALLGMPHIKLINILGITYNVIRDPHERRKFDSQAMEESNSLICRTNRIPWNETKWVQ